MVSGSTNSLKLIDTPLVSIMVVVSTGEGEKVNSRKEKGLDAVRSSLQS